MARITLTLTLPDMTNEQLLGYTKWGDEGTLRAVRTLLRESASGSASTGPGGRVARITLGRGAARQTLTINSNPAPGAIYNPSNINLAFTAVAGTPGAREFQIGATPADTAANLAAAVNTFYESLTPDPVLVATAVGADVTFARITRGQGSLEFTGTPSGATGTTLGTTFYDNGAPATPFYRNGLRVV